MLHILDYWVSAAICPMAVLCIFLLNDRWRVHPAFRWLLFTVCGPFAMWLYSALPFLPTPVRVLCPWLAILLCCWAFSAIRGVRFLFVAATGMLFAYLSVSVSGSFSLLLALPALPILLLLDAVILLLGVHFFRPAFLEVYHVLRKGWLMFSLMPLGLSSVFFALLISPDYLARHEDIFVRGSLYLLAVLTLVFYCASFYFFRKLGRWQEREINSAVLGAQISAHAVQTARRDSDNERERILRHDLRHYLLILTTCLHDGDAGAAAHTLEALNAHIESVEPSLREEAVHDA